MAGVVTVKLLDALKDIGVDVSQKQGSNVKTLATKNKSSATKPGLLASERDTGGNFGTVLDIFKKEAQFIEGMNDVEQMAFLNNIMDYKEFGGKSIKVSQGQKLKDEFDQGLGTLKDDIESLQDKAKTMKDDADAGLKSAEKDLKDFFETGGQPLKAKSDKYLGGSMHEEGQLRTAIRTFLKNEYKNGKIKLDETDQFRIMEYSPMMEDDPIKVFRKIYGDEAYNKAGTFPGAFEKGENFNHYELIFKENMGEDLLKVKDKKYTGDGTLVLTKQEEVFEPTPDVDDDGIPFAKGGRASFVGGKLVDEFIAMIVKKEPIEAMKEVNKVIGKKGKYKNLTQKDIDRIVDQTNDHIFQRDPDNLYVEDRPMFKQKDETIDLDETNKTVDDLGGDKTDPFSKDFDFEGEVNLQTELANLEGLGATKMAERFRLKQKYPGIDDDLLTNIIEDTDPVHRASVLAKIDMAMELNKTNKSAEEIIDILKKEPETKMATGGRAGFMDGGASIINPESSMNNSSGLNYLLGENDNNRVDFKNGLLVPPSKPKKPQDPMMKLMETYNTYQEALPGVSQETKKYLEQDFIKKLADQGFSINDFMTYRMQQNYANGGRAAFGGGGTMGASDKGYQGGGRDKEGNVSGDAPGAAKGGPGDGPDDRGNDRQNYVQNMVNAGYTAKEINRITNPSAIDRIKSSRYNTPLTRGILKTGAYMYNPMILGTELRDLMKLKNLYDETQKESLTYGLPQVMNPEYSMEDMTLGLMTDTQKDLIDKQGKIGQLTGAFDPDATFDAAKTFDDKGSSGIFGIGATKPEPMTREEYDQYVEQKGYAIGGRAGYEEGGPIYSRLGELNTGVSSAEQQLQQINQSIEQAQNTLGSAESGGGGASAVTPSVSGYESSGSELYDSSPAGEVTNPYVAPVGIPPEGPQIGTPEERDQFKISNTIGPGKIDNQGQDPFRDPVTGGGQPFYGPGGGLGGLLGEGGGGTISNLMAPREPGQPISDEPLGIYNKGPESFGAVADFNNKMPEIPLQSADNNKLTSLTQTTDPAREAYDKLQASVREQRRINPYTRDVKYGERMTFEDFKKSYDAGTDPNQPTYSGPQLQLQSSGGGLQYLGGGIYNSMNSRKENPLGPVQQLADGGIAGLRQGYAGGSLVDKGRRGFLKFLGGTAAGVVALKTGLAKILGKDSGAVSKKVIDEVIIDGGSGAPAWLQPLVNKALREGTDITKNNALKDGQVVKSLDTPTGKVDVYYDTRTGEVDVDYIGGNTALGESVNMRYTPGIADEGTKGVKPADEFEAVESIPEGQMAGPDDFNIEMGENITGDVKGLYSDTSELAELGGEKLLIKDISNSIQKKRVLKQMENDPADFVTDVQGDYDPT